MRNYICTYLLHVVASVENQTVKAQVFTKTVSAHLQLSKTFPQK